MMWLPWRDGKREVRKAKPLISPFTLSWPRVPQSFATSIGTRMMVQFRRSPLDSSKASKVLATDLEGATVNSLHAVTTNKTRPYNQFTMTTRILLSWSSGKDSAWALHVLRQQATWEIAGLITTINSAFD